MKYIIIYAIESSICLALFLGFYSLLLRKDTHHGSNRAFLLFSLIASFTFPLLEINLPSFTSPFNNGIINVTLPSVIITPDKSDATASSIFNIIFTVYVTGVVIASASLIVSSLRIIFLILKNKAGEGRVVIFDSNKPSCFSAFGYIFISNSVSRIDSMRMISHEMNHIKKFHFIDLLIIALAGIVQWFNPAVYFLRRLLQAVHEYEADQECILNGEEIDSYQSLLVSSAFGTNMPVLTNKFSNTSLLKKRITMMTKKRTGSLSSIKMLLAIPLAFVMFLTFSCNNSKEKQVIPEEQKSKNLSTDQEEIFVVAEQMPVFPGGDSALISFISKNVNYPEKAKKNGIQGQVIIRFCITKTGAIDQVTVQRGVDPLLDEESIRVIKMLPKFEPGVQGGKQVNVWFSLPISFKLQ